MLLTIVLHVVVVVALMHALCLVTVAGIDDLRSAVRNARRNTREVAPVAGVLGVVLAANSVVRNAGVDLAWLLGVNVTGSIQTLEGQFVAALQSHASPGLTAYFSFVYVFGYVFLLTFPVIVYALHEDEHPLAVTLVAYALNYGLGLACYVIFVAYGPRNFMPGLVDSLLFTTWPRSQVLTSQVNANTNVFPSLHTSLAVTVAMLAALYRDVSPRWLPLALVLAISVAVSTMYLGIHWLTDVVAGVGLAALSVAFAGRTVRKYRDAEPPQSAVRDGTVPRLRGR